jgi:hypothetical protein
MKKILLIFFFSISLYSDAEYFSVNTEQLKVHESFDLKSKVIDTLLYNDTLNIDNIDDQWAFIKSDSLNGYVNINYLKLCDDQESIEALKEKSNSVIDYKFYGILILIILILIYLVYQKIIRYWISLIFVLSLTIGLFYYWVYPLLLLVGYFLFNYFNKKKKSIDLKKLFQLSDQEKNEYQEIKTELNVLQKYREHLNQEIIDAGLVKTNSGKYDERNRVAKKINDELPKLKEKIKKQSSELNYLENKPINSRKKYISSIAINSSLGYFFIISFSSYLYFFFSLTNYRIQTFLMRINHQQYFHVLLILLISLMLGIVVCIILFYSYRKRYDNEIPKILI